MQEPHINLKSGSGSQSERTAAIMIRFEKELQQNPSDLVLVAGDVNFTMPSNIVERNDCKGKLKSLLDEIILIDPLGYLEFNYLVQYAEGITTDYGGTTEETTVLAIRCVTLRDNTERPETIAVGTNELIG